MAESLADTAARLEAIRNSAVSSATVDGITNSFDQAAAEKRLREIQRAQAAAAGTPDPRPIATTIRLH